MKKHVCRLCGKKNTEGIYCAKCVPEERLRYNLNHVRARKCNMEMVDWRARNGKTIVEAAKVAGISAGRWSMAELAEVRQLTGRVMDAICNLIGAERDVLFHGYAELNEHGLPKKKQEKPKTAVRKPGQDQKEIARIAREARARGLTYGKAVALEFEGRGNYGSSN